MLRLGNLWMGGVASGALSHTRTMRHCRFHLPPQPPTPTRGNPRLQHGGSGSQRLSHTRNPRLSHTRTMRHCRFHLPPQPPHSNTGKSATPTRGIRLTATVAHSKPATVAHSDHAKPRTPNQHASTPEPKPPAPSTAESEPRSSAGPGRSPPGDFPHQPWRPSRHAD